MSARASSGRLARAAPPAAPRRRLRLVSDAGHGALVCGASYRALGVVRSLGRANVPVCVARSDEHTLALASRYVQRRLRWAPGDDEDRRDALIELCRRERLHGWTLIPSDDEDAALIARHHGELAEHFVLTTPPWERFRLAHDKRALMAAADEAGVARPATRPLPAALADAALAYPVIVKPAYREREGRLPPAKAWRAGDRDELARLQRWLGSLVDPRTLMVQELIGGQEQLSHAALCRDGEVLASLTARRVRQYPLDFGRASTHVQSIDDAAVRGDAERLLAALGLSGIVEVEFKRDPRSGANKLLDVNPRVWGWQSMCARAGVDFPLLLWRMANGRSIPPTNARAGVRWVRMATDVPAAIESIRRGLLSPRAYARSLRAPLECSIFAADDPLPAAVNTPMLLRIALGRRIREGTR